MILTIALQGHSAIVPILTEKILSRLPKSIQQMSNRARARRYSVLPRLSLLFPVGHQQ